jgi:hypothetical protein
LTNIAAAGVKVKAEMYFLRKKFSFTKLKTAELKAQLY